MGKGRGRRPNRRGRKLMVNYLTGLNIPKLLKDFKKTPIIHSLLEGKVNLSINESCINFSWIDGAPVFPQKIEIASMPCNYGGFRYFGVCPCCQKRVSTLYLFRDSLECRTCLNLCYRSQNRTLSDRLYSKEKEIEKRLEEGLWTRPKWMREKTIEKLRKEFFLTEEREQIANFFSFRSIKKVDWFIEEHGGLML